jgi:ABC-type transport system involved in cytochrome bd biosynthesis fused ATPase/permease subunit
MIETALLFVLSVLSSMFAFLFYMQKKKNVQIMAQTIEFLMMQEAQQEQIKTDKEQFNEDFLKFISDSRDWAYTYIEDVQESLNKFITDIEPEINYFKEYGDIGSMAPNYHSMKKITGAYEELKKLLPEDYDRIV